MRHGIERFFIKGEGLILGRLFPPGLIHWIYSILFNPPAPASGGSVSRYPLEDDEDVATMPTRQFCRLFPKGEQPAGEALVRLGQRMETETGDPGDGRDSDIPAGYTYLGQFIDHDITLDRDTVLDDTGTVDPAAIVNFRSPALDLDSVYGRGPDDDGRLYDNDGKKLKIGQTTDVQGLGTFPNDLPREGTTAIIGDQRNDENLAVAQTHLAFLKFHNAKLAAMPGASFEDVRREVVLHYQAIVLTDFLPRVIDKAVLADVLKYGRRFYDDDRKDCMPVEFSVAAYRMGHSMVRPTYEWNRIFSTDGPAGIATFEQIFEFSGGSGSRGAGDPPFRGISTTLPSNWIVDWRRMYDMPDGGGQPHPQLNRARKMDAQMAFALKNLPEFQNMTPPPPDPFLSLATRNLLRGRLVSLPTGQDAAIAMEVTPLSADQIVTGAPGGQADLLRETGFDVDTPLWYYILREAMIEAGGNHLGTVGSRVVAETFVGLIQNSPTNVLRDRPDLKFSMPDMLTFVNDIDPLGQ